MDPLEQRLKRALEAQDPPVGFTERVLQRVAAEHNKPALAEPRPEEVPGRWNFRAWLFRAMWATGLDLQRGWRLALAGSLAVAILGVGIGYRQHQERVRGEKARQELMLALEITGKQINRVHHILITQPDGARE